MVVRVVKVLSTSCGGKEGERSRVVSVVRLVRVVRVGSKSREGSGIGQGSQ